MPRRVTIVHGHPDLGGTEILTQKLVARGAAS
jgi:hypothetical protein